MSPKGSNGPDFCEVDIEAGGISQKGSLIALRNKMRHPQRISVKGATYTVKVVNETDKKKPKTFKKKILKKVDVNIEPHTLCSIMGSTGAGKTTLLNLLAGRIEANSGSVKVNGKSYKDISIQKRLGYVMQDDKLLPTQTVREALSFCAKLTLPESTTEDAREKRVTSIIKELGLQEVENSLIGSTIPGERGISGGERKRVSIGLVLIPDPDILLLDEPTTGLDSFTAESVIDTLSDLAACGRTVICTIHQPSSQVFSKFSQLVLMTQGSVIYSGRPDSSVEYFSSIGYECPHYTNPPDFYMKLMKTGSTGNEMSLRDMSLCHEMCDKLVKEWSEVSDSKKLSYSPATVEMETLTPKGKNTKSDEREGGLYQTSFLTQFVALSQRSLKNVVRNPMLSKARTVQSVILGLLIGAIFYNQGYSPRGVKGIQGALFFMMVNQSMLPMMGVLHTFPLEMGLIMRENQASLYSIKSYFTAKSLVEFPFMVLFPFIFISIAYFLIGFRDTAGAFFTLQLIIILTSICAQSWGLFISSCASSIHMAQLLGPLILLPMMLTAGFFVDSVPVWLDWLRYVSFIRWAFEAAIVNEFEDVYIGCEGSNEPGCHLTGNEVIASLGIEDATIYRSCLIIASQIILTRLFTFLSLLWKSKTAIQQ
eukprot:TRINITY_DN8957_c0_g1_i1.p1 TRINITY_DN8957_c0_g1~~TRINITY_DN8957_c0_g1_i1.p1  ORF type:complete len:651 (+),score=116.24 TRINITY_DN8957_c0_g1_i1:2175-4127(+)